MTSEKTIKLRFIRHGAHFLCGLGGGREADLRRILLIGLMTYERMQHTFTYIAARDIVAIRPYHQHDMAESNFQEAIQILKRVAG